MLHRDVVEPRTLDLLRALILALNSWTRKTTEHGHNEEESGE